MVTSPGTPPDVCRYLSNRHTRPSSGVVDLAHALETALEENLLRGGPIRQRVRPDGLDVTGREHEGHQPAGDLLRVTPAPELLVHAVGDLDHAVRRRRREAARADGHVIIEAHGRETVDPRIVGFRRRESGQPARGHLRLLVRRHGVDHRLHVRLALRYELETGRADASGHDCGRM